jgi:ligand-binding sensor domain-containing protein
MAHVPKIMKRVLVALQAICGILIVFGLGVLIHSLVRTSELRGVPAGWQIIRPPGEVSCLALDGSRLWAGGKDGITLIDTATGRSLPPSPGTPSFGRVNALLRDSQGAMWIAHDAGLTLYHNGLFAPVPGFPAGTALSLLEDKQGRLWVGSPGAVRRRSGDDWTTLSPPRESALDAADVLFEDHEGIVWVGCASPSQGALYRFDGSSWQRFSADTGLVHSSVNMIAEDRSGALWVALGFAGHGGAGRLQSGQWTFLTSKDGLAGDKVRSIYEDRAGRLWFGSEYDGVAIRESTRWRILAPGKGLAGKEVKVVLQDPQGVFWIGTDGGLNRIAGYEFIAQVHSSLFGSAFIRILP